jgi:predicted alpha/beta-fold hydrolase
VRGGHAQTIIARYLGGANRYLASTAHEIALADGDRLLVLETTPSGWKPERPTAMLVHGLAGSADASYVVRVAERVLRLGARVIRVNLRGAGAGFGMSRGIYHAGRSDDLRAVANWLEARTAGSPLAAVGFSLGANLVLKLAAESASVPLASLDCIIAANPPIDLAACAQMILLPRNRIYDRSFVRVLRSTIAQLHRRFPELGPPGLEGVKTVYDFDDRYTARRNGFASADDYYERCGLTKAIEQITVAGLIVHALDDPFVTAQPLERAKPPDSLTVELVSHGGHLGYLSRRPWDGDRRWLDARIAAWLAARWNGAYTT